MTYNLENYRLPRDIAWPSVILTRDMPLQKYPRKEAYLNVVVVINPGGIRRLD